VTKAMGAMQDKFSRDSDYQRALNEVELEKCRKLAELEAKKNERISELDRQKLEMEKNKAKAEFEIRKAELMLRFQTDVRKIEAELFQTRLKTQSSLFERFLDYMRATLDTNTALIEQQEQLYALIEKTGDLSKSTYFMAKADKIEIMQPNELMAAGLEKVKELNLQSSEELKYLESRLENVLGIMDRGTR
jgi:hypothetical protein